MSQKTTQLIERYEPAEYSLPQAGPALGLYPLIYSLTNLAQTLPAKAALSRHPACQGLF